MENTRLVKTCQLASVGDILKYDNLTFDELFNLRYINEGNSFPSSLWEYFQIFATTKEDFVMSVWNQTHPVEKNKKEHLCVKGTKVLVWMVSRFGDVGITDNLSSPIGYDIRVSVDKLNNWELIKIR